MVRLTQSLLYLGDARHLPLKDASIHCAITSPPYWGLRDYGLSPAVWDGDPQCNHEWAGEQKPGTKLGQSGNTNGLYSKGRFDPGKVYATSGRASTSSFCSLCGAWRGSLGLEPTPALYTQHLVDVMREVRRVLRADGTLWLVLGDSYAGSWGNRSHTPDTKHLNRFAVSPADRNPPTAQPAAYDLKEKDLVGIPWRVALALQADGWWLRSDIIWSKSNPMPESVRDRPTKAHDYVFLMTKSARYFFDQEAVREPAVEEGRSSGSRERFVAEFGERTRTNRHIGSGFPWRDPGTGRNVRTVWTIPTQPYSGAHFATFPEALARRCIMAGTSEAGCCSVCAAPWNRNVSTSYVCTGRGNNNMARKGLVAAPEMARPYATRRLRKTTTTGWRPGCGCCQDSVHASATVLDPFMGSGTVGVVAAALGRSFVGVDAKPEYVQLAANRIRAKQLNTELTVHL